MRQGSLVRWVTGIILATSTGFISGCGGGGGSGVAESATFVEATADIPTTGGTVAADGITATFPADSSRTAGSVLLRVRSKPFVTTTASDLFAKGVQIVAKSSQLGTRGLTVVLPISTKSGTLQEQWYFAFGENNDDWSSDFVEAQRISPSQVSISISAAIFTKYSKLWTGSGRADGDENRGLSVSVVTARADSKGPVRLLVPKNGVSQPEDLEPLPETESLEGKRTAIIIHGLNNSGQNMFDLAQIASSTGEYDQIWFVEYFDTWDSIQNNAENLAGLLYARNPAKAHRIDVYGHSMGGLLARWMIEKAGLGRYVQRLFMFGTPNKGVPYQIFKGLQWYFEFPGWLDLSSDGDFIQSLNSQPSPYRDRVLYCTFAGTNDDYVFLGYDFGRKAKDWYVELGISENIDGIVRIGSAIPFDLSNFGVCDVGQPLTGHGVEGKTTGIFKFNHSDIGGSLENSGVQQALTKRLKQLMTSSTNVGGN